VQNYVGTGTLSIVVQDFAYYIAPNSLANFQSLRENFMMRISLDGDSSWITAQHTIQNADMVNAGVIKLSNSNMANTWTILDSNGFKYATVLYDSGGAQINLVLDTNYYPFIRPDDISHTKNDELLICGTIRELPPSQGGNQDVLLIKTDSLGNELWKRTYGNTRWEQGYAVDVCRDGGYIVSGLDDGRVWVFKTDSSGNKLWEKRYGNTVLENAPPERIIQTRDGGYAFGGGWGELPNGSIGSYYVPWIQKLDSNGDSLWAWFSVDQDTAAFNDFVTDIHEDDQGNLIACGQELIPNWDTSSIVQHKWEGFVMKLDSFGTELWKHHYFHPEASNSFAQHFLYRIEPTPDGGYVTAGYFAAPDTGTQDAWVLKLDSNGCLIPGCIITAVEDEPELPRGEVLVYPNPARDFITVELGPQRFKDQTFVLFDLQGKRVLERRLNQPISQISLQELPMGIYLYRAGNVSGKLVVE
jgi:hypothetical protein